MLLDTMRVLKEALTRHLLPRMVNQSRAPLVHIASPKEHTAQTDTLGNALGLCLLSLEREAHALGGNPHDLPAGPLALYVNVHVLLYANFSDYTESLFFLSEGINCFQLQNHFTPEDFPHLTFPGTSLRVEPVFPPHDQNAALWQQLGSPLLPSILYKVRMLRFQPEKTQKGAPGVGVLSNLLWWKKNR